MARRWSTLLVEAIDPVLARSPFLPGQTGERPAGDSPGLDLRPGASVIWCGQYDQVIATFPHLARLGVQPEETWCFDLTVEIDGEGRLAEVRLEHGDLNEAFAALERPEQAAASAQLLGQPAEVAVPELAELLADLLPPPTESSDDGP